MDNNNAEAVVAKTNEMTLSFSDWKKLKDSLNRKEATKTNAATNDSSLNCDNERNSSTTQPAQRPPPVPPLEPPPAPPQLLQRYPYIMPLMASMVPSPDMNESPLIPQLKPFVMARNQRRFNVAQTSSFNKSFPHVQRQQQRIVAKKPPSSYQQETSQAQLSQPQAKNSRLEQEASNQIAPLELSLIVSSEKMLTQPQVFVRCPQQTLNKIKGNNKVRPPWILKPPLPPPIIANTPEEREEKQRLWREYRQAMKPFKCREFANAKRTIQRLSKKKREELDEKEVERLHRAEVAVAEHKTLLSQRAAIRSSRIQEEVRAKQIVAGACRTGDNNLGGIIPHRNVNFRGNQAPKNRRTLERDNSAYQQKQCDQFKKYPLDNSVTAGIFKQCTGISIE